MDDITLSAQNSARPLAVVTGASSGIGYELAKQFAVNGFDVLLCAEDEAVTAAAATLAAAGTTVRSVRADLATYDGVEHLLAEIRAAGRVHAAAINAGVGVAGPFTQTSLEDDLRLVQLNVASTVHLAKRVLQQMVTQGEGRVLFTSSIAATMPGPWYATYAASKAFVQAFAEAVRYELKDTGVSVTALMPGPTDTNFFDRAGMQDTPVDSKSKDDPADVARDGFEALMAGKDLVVAGSRTNAVQASAARLLPDRVKAAAHARLTEPEPKSAGEQTP
jgi:short-subunit dehydrogenase